ncbi:MAG: hypothetical protein J7K75_01790 [Desulfuromonas sp.]|nr:hypothetical protein [Desulfuromonas sp.]
MMKYHRSSYAGRKGSGPSRSSGSHAIRTQYPLAPLLVTLVFKAISLLTFFGAYSKKVRRLRDETRELDFMDFKGLINIDLVSNGNIS